MLYILTIADRGLVSHAQAFRTRQAAEEGLIKYLKENESYDGSSESDAAWRWLEEHDERLSVEIVEQEGDPGAEDSTTALRRIYDVLYLDLNKNREFYNEEKAWDADTTTAIAEIVRQFFPKPPMQTAEADEDELTPADRAKFVQRIEKVSPYDEGLDAEGNMACPSDFVTDLLTDIRHYCDARGVDFAACDQSAYRHYVNEYREGTIPQGIAQPADKTAIDEGR
jgi:hypothetical protein